MANRYQQYNSLEYTPESFKDMAVAPVMMRQRHDALLGAQDKLLLELENTKVQGEAQDYYNQKRDELKSKVEMLSSKLNKVGAGDVNLMNEFRNAKREYNTEMSLSGGIGKSADLKKNIDSQKDNYYKFGLTQGWTPQKIEENWKGYYQDYFKDFSPENLSNKNFAFQEFNPTFAPKYMEPIDIIKDVAPLIGNIKDAYANSKLVPYTNPLGEIAYSVVTEKGETIKNTDQLNNLSKWMKETLMDPASPAMTSLRYGNPGRSDDEIRKEFLGRADSFIQGVMPNTSTELSKTMTNPNFSGLGSSYGSGSSGSTKTTKEEDTASLTSVETGKEAVPIKDISSVLSKKELKELEAKEMTSGLSEQESAKKELLIQQDYAITKALNDKNIYKQVNDRLIKGSLKGGIDVYKNKIAELESLQRSAMAQYEKTGNWNPDKGPMLGIAQRYGREAEILSLELKEAMKPVIESDALKFSRMYTFGSGDASNKAADIISKSSERLLTSGAILPLLESGGGDFTLSSDGDQTPYNSNNEDKLSDLKNIISQGNVKLDFASIHDMGTTGDSKISFKYTSGSGDKIKTGRISLDYNNNTSSKATDDFLEAIQEGLNPQGKAVIQSFIDNKKYKGLSVDSRPDASGKNAYVKNTLGFSKAQDSKIKEYSKQIARNENLDIAGKTKEEYAKINYITSNPKNVFNMYLNTDGFYEMAGKDNSQSKSSWGVNAGMWFNREFYKISKKNGLKSNNISNAKPEDKSTYVREVASLVRDAMRDGEDALIQIGGQIGSVENKRFQELKQKYAYEIDENEDNLDAQFEITNRFIQEISKMRIAHRNKKRFL